MMRVLALLLTLPLLAHADTSPKNSSRRTGALKIGVFSTGSQGCAQRMRSVLKDATVETLKMTDGMEVFKKYDLLVLPSCWTNSWAQISKNRENFTKFVQRGGALLMFQPNPFKQGEELEIDLLPQKIKIHNRYSDTNVEIVGDHELTKGFDEKDMPFPHDRITGADKRWKILARGAQTQDGCFAVTRHGRGRAAVCLMGHNNRAGGYMSDAFLKRLMLWMTFRKFK